MSSFFITFKSKSNKNEKKIKKEPGPSNYPSRKKATHAWPHEARPFFSFHVVSLFFFEK